MSEWTPVGDSGALVRSRWIYNCYVVSPPGADQPFVVDVGLPSHGQAVADVLASQNAPSATVAATHLHADHVAGLPALTGERGHAGEVVLPERARAYAELGDEPRTPGPREVARILPVMRSQPFSFGALWEAARSPGVGYGLSPFALPSERPTWIDDGQPVPGAPGWVAVIAPGHTDDSMGYYHSATRTFASGDAVLTVDGRAWFNPEYVDGPVSAATEDRLRSLPVDILLPGHGRPLVGRDLLSHALGHDDRPPKCR